MAIETELAELDALHALIKIRLKADRGGDGLKAAFRQYSYIVNMPQRRDVKLNDKDWEASLAEEKQRYDAELLEYKSRTFANEPA